jgi:hypothetical protein
MPIHSSKRSKKVLINCATKKEFVKLYEIEYFFWVEEGGLINACQRTD